MTDFWAQLDSTARRIKVSGIQKMDLKDTRFAVKSLDSRDKRHRKVTYRAFLREVLERTKSPGAVLCCAVAFKQSGVSKLKKEGRETLLNRMKPNIQIFKDLDSIATENGIRCPTHLELEPTRANTNRNPPVSVDQSEGEIDIRNFENASLEGIQELFAAGFCRAIRRDRTRDGVKAAVTTSFPRWPGEVPCLMSVAILESEVSRLAWDLFNAEVELINQTRCIGLNDGIKLAIPGSEAILKGVWDEAILNVFGRTIQSAIDASPIRSIERNNGISRTECVSMNLLSDGAIVNLNIGLEKGFEFRQKLYFEEHNSHLF
jgi:hypothetical protein